ncbi:MAG: AAA family ATPase [Thermoplasmataceae archaeon]
MIIVTGMPGSGKDEFIKVARSLGMVDVHMGNTVKDYAKKMGIPENDASIGRYAGDERQKFGMDIWARRTAEKISDPDMTIVDGLRNMEELQYFRSRFHGVRVIAIYANREQRLERILKRNRPDDVKSEIELDARDSRELNWGIGKAISLADYMIVNDGTLEQFKEKSRKLLKGIIGLQA